MEAIVFSGTKLNIDYYINKILDEEQQKEIMDYFMEATTDNIKEAFEEFEGEYDEEDLRLMRLKLHSKHGIPYEKGRRFQLETAIFHLTDIFHV